MQFIIKPMKKAESRVADMPDVDHAEKETGSQSSQEDLLSIDQSYQLNQLTST
jgi:hypothetical protein